MGGELGEAFLERGPAGSVLVCLRNSMGATGMSGIRGQNSF